MTYKPHQESDNTQCIPRSNVSLCYQSDIALISGRTAYVIILNKILIKVHCIIHVLHVILHSVLYNIASPLSFSLFVLWICHSFGFHFPSPYLVLFRHNYLANRNIMNILYGCKWKCFLCRNPVLRLVLNRDAWYLSD